MAKKWYVLHTYSGYENKVKSNLEQRIEAMGLENNVFGIEIPTEMVTEIKEGGRRVESEKKVFPGYVLVRMELDDRSWAAVRNTPGVTGFVGSQGNPQALTLDEYNKIMKRTKMPKNSRATTTTPLQRSTSVRVGHVTRFISDFTSRKNWKRFFIGFRPSWRTSQYRWKTQTCPRSPS